MSDSFPRTIVAHIPVLRTFAMTLAKSRPDADDLVQDALVRAWRYRRSYKEGTNVKAWLRRILRNCFYQDLIRRRDTVEDVDGRWAAQQTIAPSQEWFLLYREMLTALNRLTPDTREALLLVTSDGFSYEEAAKISSCAIGTLKSRVNRARERLGQLTGHAPHRRLIDETRSAPPSYGQLLPEINLEELAG